MTFTSRLLILFVLSGIFFNEASAQKLHDQINWSAQPSQLSLTDDYSISYLTIAEGDNYAELDFLPMYGTTLPIGQGGEVSASFTKATFEPLTNWANLPTEHLSDEVVINAGVGYEKGVPSLEINFIPVRLNPITGQAEKLVDFELEYNITPKYYETSAERSATTSVLSTGSWYKLSTNQDAVYRIDYNYLTTQLGVSASGLNFNKVGIFGNGGGMVPSENADARPDDLVEVAISVVDQNDNGTWETGDYILFYGNAAHQWYWNGTEYRHEQNLYTDQAYYFFSPDQGTGKPISSQNSVSGTADFTANQYDNAQFFEEEKKSLLASGTQWYGGELNSLNPTQTVLFNYPNRLTSAPIDIKVRFVSRSVNAPSTSVSAVANSTGLGSISYSSVSGIYYDTFARANSLEKSATVSGGDNIDITLTYSGGSDGQGWLDYIEAIAACDLRMTGSQMNFMNLESIDYGITEFVLANAPSNIHVWDVSDHNYVKKQSVSQSGSTQSFKLNTADELHRFVALDVNASSSFPTPTFVGAVENQNLHAIGAVTVPDMIIVAHSSLMGPAQELASFHNSYSGLNVVTVDVAQVYNEFASGKPDMSAIRDFMKMLYERGTASNELKYLLLYGEASYDFKDRITGNTNLVPAYQSSSSLDPASTYVTDDYFACLDPSEGGNLTSTGSPDKLDIAVGRIPAKNAEDAYAFNNKIFHYKGAESFGSWRNLVTFVADDEDGAIHLTQADFVADEINEEYPVYNVDKIYFDAFLQENTSAGDRYPDVHSAILKRLFTGSLIMNYTGHGGVTNWAHERVFDSQDIRELDNIDKLPLFVTATCELSRFDNPAYTSMGEVMLMHDQGGSIGMVTTVRLVYSGENFTLAKAFYRNVFEPVAPGQMPTVGEVLTSTKNSISSTSNNRKFVLLGDPALVINYPQYDVVTTAINGNPVGTATIDTMKALASVTVSGEVRDLSGNLMSDFNGTVTPTVYDKPQKVTTQANDPGSPAIEFELQKNIIYKGNASVTNGQFEFEFIVPKDINYSFDTGKISYYSDNLLIDAHGYGFDMIVGGAAENFETDNEGPRIEVYMNDEKFVFGGITDEDPIMLVKLQDDSGINTVGNGVGHDIAAVLDGNTQQKIILNDYYEAELDNFRAGTVRYPFFDLEEGLHTLKVTAWDVHNNMGEGYTEFVVASSAQLALEHVLNYPNPFTTQTMFMFEHNRPGDLLDINIGIYSVSGKLVKTIYTQVQSEGYRVDGIYWDGLDEYGDPIGKGVYVYKVKVSGSDGYSANAFEKLVILR